MEEESRRTGEFRQTAVAPDKVFGNKGPSERKKPPPPPFRPLDRDGKTRAIFFSFLPCKFNVLPLWPLPTLATILYYRARRDEKQPSESNNNNNNNDTKRSRKKNKYVYICSSEGLRVFNEKYISCENGESGQQR